MNAVFTQSAAQNDTCGVVILNEVKDLILKWSHYQGKQILALRWFPRSRRGGLPLTYLKLPGILCKAASINRPTVLP